MAPSPQVFCRTAGESWEGTYCPVLQSSLRGALCLGDVEPWGPEVRGQEECSTMWQQWQVRQRPRETRGAGDEEPEALMTTFNAPYLVYSQNPAPVLSMTCLEAGLRSS